MIDLKYSIPAQTTKYPSFIEIFQFNYYPFTNTNHQRIMIHSMAILSTALLFGGMTLYSFGFAAFLFNALPAPTAGSTLRRAFPWFYGFVIVTAALAGLFWWPTDTASAAVMGVVALTAVAARQLLMPAINAATDTGQRKRFQWLHGLSVLITLGHIAGTGWLLANIG
jgi:Domain of unknown function (DUF4149)